MGFGLSLSFDRDFDLLGLGISHLPSCLPSLRRFMLPGFIATMKTLTAVCGRFMNEEASIVCSVRLRCQSQGQGFVVQSPQLNLSHSLHVLATNSSPCLSHLIFRPFHLQPPHRHFFTIDFARYFTVVNCRVYPPGRPVWSGDNRRAVKGSQHCQQAPRQAWPN